MRRAHGVLAAGLVLTAAATGTLAQAAAPAQASRAGASQPGYPVSIAVTGMTPQWATPGAVMTVSGTVTNESKAPISHLQIQLNYGSQPIAGYQQLLYDLQNPRYPLAYNPVTGHVTQPAGTLKPGASSTWSVTFSSKQVGMTSFGVYALTADAFGGSFGPTLDTVNVFLPYVPASSGKHPTYQTPRDQIAWLWPLLSTPLTPLPGKRDCTSTQAKALAASLAPGGRLAGLLTVGRAYTAADGLTWAVDPALLSAVQGLTRCGTVKERADAAAWLDTVRAGTSGQQLFATPYADVSFTLIRHSDASDVQSAFSLGRLVAQGVLGRSAQPSAAGAAGTAWPPDYFSQAMLQNLAEVDGIRTFVLPSDAVSGTPGTVFTTTEGAASVRVLVADSSLTQVLAAATGTTSSRFATTDQFLALTALLAAERTASPIIVAPPRQPGRWRPAPALAANLLADTSRAPWLAPATLSSLAGAAKATDPRLAFTSSGPSGPLTGGVLRALRRVDTAVVRIGQLQASTNPGLGLPSSRAGLAVAALESAQWGTHSGRLLLARLSRLARYLDRQEKDVFLVTDSRVTLGGLKGSVPVLIDNRLDYPVRVRVRFSYPASRNGTVTVTQHPDGLVTVAAHSQVSTRLRVQASQVGSTTISLRLVDQAGQLLPGGQTVTVQATQFGTFAMIILAAALGIFVLASATRGLRRGRGSQAGGRQDPPPAGGSQQAQEPDTVVSDPSDLGAVTPPGRR